MDSHKVASLVIVGCRSGHFSSLCRGDFGDVHFGKILSRVIHFPLFSKVIDSQPKEPHLCTIQDNSFGLFLGPYKLIDANNPAQIPNITEDDNIIFQTSLFCNLRSSLIHIHLIIKFVAHLNQMISSGFFIDQLSWVVYQHVKTKVR